jgi:DNA-binding transcriptional ArsR family regulator
LNLITERTISVVRTAPPPLLPIFRSDAQARLLTALYLRDRRPRPISAVAAAAGVPLPSAHRELDRLITAGLVTEERVGRQRLVAAAEDGLYYEPLHTLLDRAFGPPAVLAAALAEVPGIEFAAIYGSYAARRMGEEGPAPQDLDLLVVGDADADDVYTVVEVAERDIALPVNPTLMTPDEWHADSGFTRQLRSRPLLVLVGSPA